MHPPPDLAAIRRALEALSPRPVTGDAAKKRAAVATVLRQREEPEVLLIRRAEHPADPWSGHMAFPGGRHDPTDEDLLHTALRETREEVGLDLDRAGTLLGQLHDVPAVARGRRTGMAITPFVFRVEDLDPELHLNYEVDEALWAPLGPMMRGEVDSSIDYRRDGLDLTLPAFDVDGRIVWGLTYQMLRLLFDTIRGE